MSNEDLELNIEVAKWVFGYSEEQLKYANDKLNGRSFIIIGEPLSDFSVEEIIKKIEERIREVKKIPGDYSIDISFTPQCNPQWQCSSGIVAFRDKDISRAIKKFAVGFFMPNDKLQEYLTKFSSKEDK